METFVRRSAIVIILVYVVAGLLMTCGYYLRSSMIFCLGGMLIVAILFVMCALTEEYERRVEERRNSPEMKMAWDELRELDPFVDMVVPNAPTLKVVT